MRRVNPEVTILNEASATGWGDARGASDARHSIVTVASSGVGAGETITYRMAVSNSETAPTFSSAASNTNRWSYTRFRDMATGTLYKGDGSGDSISTSNEVIRYAIEEDNYKWININVTVFTGTATISAYLSTANDTE